VHAINTHGEMLWKQKLDRGSTASPLVDADGNVFVGADDSNLYAFTSTGAEVRCVVVVTGGCLTHLTPHPSLSLPTPL